MSDGYSLLLTHTLDGNNTSLFNCLHAMLASLLTGHAFLQVWVTSTSLTHRAHTDSDQDVAMETKLEGEVNIITAKTLVTPSMIL